MKAVWMFVVGLMLTCSAHAALTVDGNYKMKLKIGDKFYDDVMELHGKDFEISAMKYQGKLKGSITVPNVFKADLEGFGDCSYEALVCKFNFEIMARENGDEYKVIYQATLSGLDYKNFVRGATKSVRLTGTAATADGIVFGTFEAIRE